MSTARGPHRSVSKVFWPITQPSKRRLPCGRMERELKSIRRDGLSEVHMSSNQPTAGDIDSTTPLSAGGPQRPQDTGGKKHQLTVPNGFSRPQIAAHVSRALDSVSKEMRVAVFEPSGAEPALVVTDDNRSPEYSLTQIADNIPNTERVLSREEVVETLVDTLSVEDRGKGGEFFTKPATGPGHITDFVTR